MATWNDNAITDVGLELLEHTLTAGKTLTLSRAAVGGGHVESAELKDQTELSSVLADVTVLIAEQLRLEGSSGIQIKLQIRNDGITSACTYKQVGMAKKYPRRRIILISWRYLQLLLRFRRHTT